MIRAKRMLEARVCRAWINEKRQAELAHVPQPLKHIRVNELERQLVDTDVIPERVAQNLEVVPRCAHRGRASALAGQRS